MTPDSTTRISHAIVIGAGFVGLLAAATIAEHADRVTLIERDQLPDSPQARTGLPQAAHVHVLWSGGVHACEALLPGITDEWIAAGARRIALPTDLVTMTAQGWIPRWEEMHFNLAASRALTDHVLRTRVLDSRRHPGIELLDQHEVIELAGSASAVTGVVTRTPDGTERTLDADLVVDTCGRQSRAESWLAEFGVTGIQQHQVDSGLAYATRLFHAPPGTGSYPIVNVQSDPSEPVPGQTATIVPEGDLWRVTLSGTKGGVPTPPAGDRRGLDPKAPQADAPWFVSFAKGVRHPIVGDLIENLVPAAPIVVTRSTKNSLLRFDKADLPGGFLALGDSIATFNPLYGQGMTVGAQGLVAVRELMRRSGPARPGFSRRAQKAVTRPAATAFQLATSQDCLYPGATGMKTPPGSGLLNAYVNRLMRNACTDPLLAQAFLDVITMTKPPVAWFSPRVVTAVIRRRRPGALTEPPLTADELATVLSTTTASEVA
ncbi:FAD-dependent oxidoreductase [Streptomyces goshikiensis]|uniref:FAD-dependent oxidoreductase n=1 Tax=Streptomyces goshikiensis TaxID=1942 RepID=UPI003687ECB3